jgi:hypothetical protein
MARARLALRVMQWVFILYAVLLLWLIRVLKPQEPPGPVSVVHEAIAVLAVIDCLAGFVVRRVVLTGSAGRLSNGARVSPVKRWFTANVIGLAFAMSTCLFGFALHMLSAPDRLAQALVGVGIVAMLFLSPGAPPADQPGSSG